jgi:flagellar hook-associated protein 3 FlgL
LNAALWNAAGNTKDYRVVFAEDSSNSPGPSVYTYDIVTNSATTINGVAYAAGRSLLTGAASAPTLSATGGPTYPRTYIPGATISFKNVTGDTNPNAWDLGAEFSISGTPSSNPTLGAVIAPDTFTLKGSSNNQDLFATIHSLVGALRNTSGAALSNHVMSTLNNLTQAEDVVLTAIAEVGVTMKEVESQSDVSEDLVVQYKTTISDIEDLDYAEAISALTLRQSNLEASQKSFLTISGLSLFNYI